MSKFDVLWVAFAFMLMFEGMGPLLFPRRWQKILSDISKLPEGNMRVLGAALIVSGLLLYWRFAT